MQGAVNNPILSLLPGRTGIRPVSFAIKIRGRPPLDILRARVNTHNTKCGIAQVASLGVRIVPVFAFRHSVPPSLPQQSD